MFTMIVVTLRVCLADKLIFTQIHAHFNNKEDLPSFLESAP